MNIIKMDFPFPILKNEKDENQKELPKIFWPSIRRFDNFQQRNSLNYTRNKFFELNKRKSDYLKILQSTKKVLSLSTRKAVYLNFRYKITKKKESQRTHPRLSLAGALRLVGVGYRYRAAAAATAGNNNVQSSWCSQSVIPAPNKQDKHLADSAAAVG